MSRNSFGGMGRLKQAEGPTSFLHTYLCGNGRANTPTDGDNFAVEDTLGAAARCRYARKCITGNDLGLPGGCLCRSRDPHGYQKRPSLACLAVELGPTPRSETPLPRTSRGCRDAGSLSSRERPSQAPAAQTERFAPEPVTRPPVVDLAPALLGDGFGPENPQKTQSGKSGPRLSTSVDTLRGFSHCLQPSRLRDRLGKGERAADDVLGSAGGRPTGKVDPALPFPPAISPLFGRDQRLAASVVSAVSAGTPDPCKPMPRPSGRSSRPAVSSSSRSSSGTTPGTSSSGGVSGRT